MKAMSLAKPGGLDQLTAIDMPESRHPSSNEIKVRIEASSLNYHDYVVVTGMTPAADGRIPLSDCAGRVTAMGESVTQFKVGDMVISTFFPKWADGPLLGDGFRTVPGDGVDGYALEWVTAPETEFTPAPTGYDALEAATLPCAGVTAWRALMTEGGIRPGDVVLVQGTGGVSIFALQFAKMVGAKVVATSSSDAKLQRLKEMGADVLINYRDNPDWGSIARRACKGGVDRVVEVGGPGTLEQSIAAVKNGGHIALIGILSGFSGPVSTSALMAKQIRLFGLTVGTHQHQRDMVRAINASGLRPIVDRSFPLTELAEAFRYQATGQHFGKICIEI